MPATAMPSFTCSRTSRGTAASSSARAAARQASSSAGVGGSVWMWRSVWRTEPSCVDTKNSTLSPCPTTTSVLPPPMSSTSVGAA